MTQRRKRFCILTAVIVLGLIAIQSTAFVRPLREISVSVDGTPGQSVVASFDVDGKRHEEKRELPTTFKYEARKVTFTVIPENSPSEDYLNVKAHLDDKHILFCRDRNGVQGNVTAPSLLGLGGNNTGIGGMRPDEIASLP